MKTKAAAVPQCIEEKVLPLAGALAGSEQGIVDVHGGLAAPQRHALPHLHRLLPVARIAAAVTRACQLCNRPLCLSALLDQITVQLLMTARRCAVVVSHAPGLALCRTLLTRLAGLPVCCNEAAVGVIPRGVAR